MTTTQIPAAVTSRTTRLTVSRTVAVVGLVTASVVHVPVAAQHLDEARYLLLLFDALVLVLAALAGLLLVTDGRLVWSLALGICAASLIGYVVSRSVGLPLAGDDIGDWLNPLGLVAVIAEFTVIVVALNALARSHRS